MSEHRHIWVHRETLGGVVIEKCGECRRARIPRLSAAEAAANDGRLANAHFKRVYGGHIADLFPTPHPLASLMSWATHEPLGQRLDVPRTISTSDGVITHVDGVALDGMVPRA